MEQVSESADLSDDQQPKARAVRHYADQTDTHDTATLTVLPRLRREVLLTRVVESEILPRLTIVRTSPPAVEPAWMTTEDDTTALVSLLLTQPAGSAIAFVKALQASGATPASLYLGIITQAARRLGELWQDDRCGFADVTIGVGHLQQVVRAVSPAFQVSALAQPHADTVLLMPAPGEQHTFGLIVLSEFFRREGWHVVGGPVSSGHDAARLVRDTWIDVAGFSIGSDHLLNGLTACITRVRKASRNREIHIMVGGPMLLTHPDLVKLTGADAAAVDAPGAVRKARALLAFREAAD